jgi:hypothetical protein
MGCSPSLKSAGIPQFALLSSIGLVFWLNRKTYFRDLMFCITVGCSVACGCSLNPPLQINIVPIDSNDRAAKPSNCLLPILRSEPIGTDYQKIAIVEGWGPPDQKNEILDDVRQKACTAGADALLVVSSQTQADGRLETMDLPSTTSDNDAGNSNRSQEFQESLMPRIGQPGHPGFYIDAVAIVFRNGRVGDRRSP